MKVKSFRKKAGLSQAQLAEQIGTTQVTIARWENGVCEPSGEMLAKLADVFGVSKEEVLETDEEKIMRNSKECGLTTALKAKNQINLQVKRKQLVDALTANDWDRLIEIISELSLIAEIEFEFFYLVLEDKKLENTKKYVYAFVNALN